MRWTGLLPAAILPLALLVSACGESIPPIVPQPDGGSAADGGSDGGGPPPPAWPAETLVLLDAHEPALSQAPDGTLTLTYAKEGKVWVQRPVEGGSPVEIGGGVGGAGVEIHVASHPTEDRIFLVWNQGQAATLTAGVPDGPAFLVYLDNLGGTMSPRGAGWFGDDPVVFGQTSEVWIGPDTYPPTIFAFTVPLSTPGDLPLPAPSADVLLQPNWNGFHYYEESFTPHDMGDGNLLVFFPWAQPDVSDPFGSGVNARWRLLHPDFTRTGPARNYLAGLGGDLLMPEPHAAWIQLWPLGPDRYAMTWGGTPTSLVFEVFVTGVTLDENHEPTLDATYANVSATSGATQNSDHAIVRPTGDGRAWLAWRETDYGPRVALLSEDLQPTLILTPAVNFPCALESSIGARVDAEGTLHLVAGTRADEGTGRQVRYWKIPLP